MPFAKRRNLKSDRGDFDIVSCGGGGGALLVLFLAFMCHSGLVYTLANFQ